jgi:hypothetical protein
MGTITRSFANNITTSGILLPASLNNASLTNVTAYNASVATGNMVLISSQTASNSASISFTTGISSTYKEYQFYFVDIHARTDSQFNFQTSTNGGSSYGVTLTNSYFVAYHAENDSATSLQYDTNYDNAQTTSFVSLSHGTNSGADESCAGSFSLFNPASTTYVKHYISRFSNNLIGQYAFDINSAGYFNTTSAINAVQFKMASGNFDGTILMYGIV